MLIYIAGDKVNALANALATKWTAKPSLASLLGEINQSVQYCTPSYVNQRSWPIIFAILEISILSDLSVLS